MATLGAFLVIFLSTKIYQNKYWTIRWRVACFVDPLLKIVGFQEFKYNGDHPRLSPANDTVKWDCKNCQAESVQYNLVEEVIHSSYKQWNNSIENRYFVLVFTFCDL